MDGVRIVTPEQVKDLLTRILPATRADEDTGAHLLNLAHRYIYGDPPPEPDSNEAALVTLDGMAAALESGGLQAAVEVLEKAGRPEALPAETWKQEDPPARPWLIPGLIPAGRLCSLYGVGGAGKSRLALQVAAGLMDGTAPLAADPDITGEAREALRGDWPVLQPCGDPRRVLLLTWEDERDEVLRRWRAAHHAGAITAQYPDPKLLSLVDMRKVGGPLWGPEEGQHVSTAATWTPAGKRFLESLHGHALAIVDPLAAAYASSEIDRSLVRAFCSALDGKAEAAACAVLLIGHQPKTDSDYSGSTDWQAAVRGQLVLEVSDETAHVLEGKPGKGREKPAKARAYRIRNAKQSYAVAGNYLWLRREWQAPGGGEPARLAWFATTCKRACEAYESEDVQAVEDVEGSYAEEEDEETIRY